MKRNIFIAPTAYSCEYLRRFSASFHFHYFLILKSEALLPVHPHCSNTDRKSLRFSKVMTYDAMLIQAFLFNDVLRAWDWIIIYIKCLMKTRESKAFSEYLLSVYAQWHVLCRTFLVISAQSLITRFENWILIVVIKVNCKFASIIENSHFHFKLRA